MQIVLEFCQQIVRSSRHVSLGEEALTGFARQLINERLQPPRWEPRYHFSGEPERLAHYLLLLDALNFCFWPEPRWMISYKGETLNGYWALATSLKRAFEAGRALDDADHLATMTEEKLKQILDGTNEIPLLIERTQILREVGQVLSERFEGRAIRLFEAAEGSVVRLVELLTENFRSFRDEAVYNGQKVYFYKRAQILAADLHDTFGGKGLGKLRDLEKLTAFADYKLPQVLRHLGILGYDDELAARIDAKQLIPAGSPEEIEIRAHTVWAVERIRQELKLLGVAMRSYELDWILWSLGQQDEFRARPYHRTVTIYY
jgi:hypothetical protein